MIKSVDKLVQLAQISGGINAQCRFEDKWFVEHSYETQQAIVHIVVSGQGYFKIEGESESRLLKSGDIIFFSRATRHIFSHQSSCENDQDQPMNDWHGSIQIKQTGSGRDLQLFCAHFFYDKHADLFQHLPDHFTINLAPQTLTPILSLLQQEVSRSHLGSQQIIDSLSNVLLIAIIRTYLESEPNAVSGVLNGIYDHRLTRVLDKILTAPERDWTVENIVAESHLSRAQLMRVFKQQIGVSPHYFVLRTRLQKAALQLKQTNETVLSVALNCGFVAEAHFIKAFKSLYGLTPNAYRKAG